jgi:hypothetical protein
MIDQVLYIGFVAFPLIRDPYNLKKKKGGGGYSQWEFRITVFP